MHLPCRSRRQGCRGNTWSGAQENFCHTNSNSAPEKENDDCSKKEATDADPIANAVGCRFAKKEKVSCARGNAIGHDFAKKKESFANTGGIAITVAEEEKGFTNSKCNANLFTASQEKRVAYAAAV